MSIRNEENVMGSIYLRKDGRYEGRCKDANGGKTFYFYGKSHDEVCNKMNTFWEGQSYCQIELTVRMLFEEWVETVKLRLKQSTLANYLGKAETHILPAFGNVRADELDVSHVQRFIADKLNSGLSSNYVADIVILLKSVMKYAVNRYNIRNRIADVIMPKKKKAEVLLLSKHQQIRLQKYLGKNQSLTSLGVALSLFTGLRIGELCALQWSDIDLSNRTVSVSRTIQRISVQGGTQLVITDPKSISSVREIPIPDCIFPLLKKFCSKGEFYILSGTDRPVEPRTMQYRFQSLLKKAKLPSIHFHALRHMFATNCVELDFDVKSLSEILGHSGVEITLNRYVHSSLERKKVFMRKLKFTA